MFGWFKRKPHVCDYKFTEFCEHFGMVHDLREFAGNDHYYPSQTKINEWINQGYNWASVFQSYFKCNCGKSKVFFFLENPCEDYRGRKRKKSIPKTSYEELIKLNPIDTILRK